MDLSSKANRTVLKGFFEAGDIPTEEHFSALIDGMINHAEDKIAKIGAGPVSLEAEGSAATDQPVLDLYKNFGQNNPNWSLVLNPLDTTQANARNSGLSINTGTGAASRLFIEESSGNIGLGTTDPANKLAVVANGEVLGLYSDRANGHVYIAFFNDGQGGARSGYFGYASNNTNHLSIINNMSNGDLILDSAGSIQLRSQVEMTGRLFLPSAEASNLTGTGSLVIGASNGLNMGLDTSEIQVRTSNSQGATLQLNPHGGLVSVGAGGMTVSGNLNIGGNITNKVNITYHQEVLLVSGTGSLVIGTSNGRNLGIDRDELQARNNTAATTLRLNPHGGLVFIGSGGMSVGGDLSVGGTFTSKLNLAYTQDVSLTAGSGSLVIGAANTVNLGLDNNEIQARNNTAAASLALNPLGGVVTVGLGGMSISGVIRVSYSADVSPTAGTGSIVIGSNAQINMGIDNEEIQVRTSNNVGARLRLNPGGGDVTVNGLKVASDLNLKTSIEPLSAAVEKLNSIRGVFFKWKEKSRGEEMQLGVIAQEVESVFPELVNRDPKYQTRHVNYFGLFAPVIEAIKELHAEIQQLKQP